MVGVDVVDGVGCGLARVDLDGTHFSPVYVGRDAEVEVCLGAGDGAAEVLVAVPYLDDGGVVAVDLYDGRYIDCRCGVGSSYVRDCCICLNGRCALGLLLADGLGGAARLIQGRLREDAVSTNAAAKPRGEGLLVGEGARVHRPKLRREEIRLRRTALIWRCY